MDIPKLIEEHKSVFGAYAEMALLNIKTVLDHIQKMADIDGALDEKSEDYWKHPVMLYLKNQGGQAEKITYIIEKLFECMPFLKIWAEAYRLYDQQNNINNKQSSDLKIGPLHCFIPLNNAIRVIKTYRDACTHLIFHDDRFTDGCDFLKYNEQNMARTINDYYAIALRNIKEKYNYCTKDLAFIQDFRYKKNTDRRPGKPRMILDMDFFLCMESFNEDKTKKFHLSGVGVTQLICLFLEKQYINIFLSKLPIYGEYKINIEKQKIIRRSLSINSIVLPKERIRSEKGSMSIAMDMLNELKRCPRELFDTLSYSDQSRFRTVSADLNEVLQMRHSDRFAQLALQYIDYNRLFNSIRFHVNMGKLRYLFSGEKLCIDGETRVRVLEHLLNGFGRVQEMEQKRKSEKGNFAETCIAIHDFEHIKRDDATPENYPYVVDTYTHYLLENNKVEFSFVQDDIMPKIREKNGKWYVDKEIPACRMSTLELPAMMFHMHLMGAQATEEHIHRVYENYRKLFTALSSGTLTKSNIGSFGIAMADIPQKVLDAVNGTGKNKDIQEWLLKETSAMLEDTQIRIKRLKEDKRTVRSRQNKIGKPGFKQISAGRLADFLAKDIVMFQPSLAQDEDYGTDRLTGLNYRVMQASIATFSISRGDVEGYTKFCDMFKAAGLVGTGKKSHPFLYKVLQQGDLILNTIDFYERYINEKAYYLRNILTNYARNAGRIACPPYLNPNRNKWQEPNAEYYSMLGDIYMEDQPIELPRQMFDEAIKAKLMSLTEMEGVDFEKANVTFLIAEYLKRVCHDDFQQFYSFKRNYRYMDMLVCKTAPNKSLCVQYLDTTERENLWNQREARCENYSSWARRKKDADRNMSKISSSEFEEILKKRLSNCRNDFQKGEKTIRRYRIQDALLFLMAKDTLTQHLDFAGKEFLLMDIMPDTDKGILSEIMPIDFKFEKNGKTYTIHSAEMKIKNYGDFFSLIHDRRLSTLLPLVTDATIDKTDLEQEFSNYDSCRPVVVKLILDFEKFVYNKFPDMLALAKREDHFDFGKILQELFKREKLSEEDTWVMSQIRNAFNHNSYPKEGVIRINTLPEIAKQLIVLFQDYTADI